MNMISLYSFVLLLNHFLFVLIDDQSLSSLLGINWLYHLPMCLSFPQEAYEAFSCNALKIKFEMMMF